ncbi:DUF1145 domain-containing protein [Gallaecimonas kandeliae]|uniref:DUF1145 domain-containing protein n=1 Tax=Gallaecimonas kandeliae TaxID=3029055 RepID=UPI002648FA51|nr:DUF1145 domain-containing protein [Gallaecimonas kandeliae]WKE65468.1 DUF1145 domain-containing protein [Gallaecimonas kandeliae]
MTIIKRLLMAAIWLVCLYNLVVPLPGLSHTVFLVAMAVFAAMHGIMVLLFSKVLQLDTKGKLDIFFFGSIAASERRDALMKAQSLKK